MLNAIQKKLFMLKEKSLILSLLTWHVISVLFHT